MKQTQLYQVYNNLDGNSEVENHFCGFDFQSTATLQTPCHD